MSQSFQYLHEHEKLAILTRAIVFDNRRQTFIAVGSTCKSFNLEYYCTPRWAHPISKEGSPKCCFLFQLVKCFWPSQLWFFESKYMIHSLTGTLNNYWNFLYHFSTAESVFTHIEMIGLTWRTCKIRSRHIISFVHVSCICFLSRLINSNFFYCLRYHMRIVNFSFKADFFLNCTLHLYMYWILKLLK